MYTKIIRSLSKGRNEAKFTQKVMKHKNIINVQNFNYVNLENDTIGIKLELENYDEGDLSEILSRNY